MSDSGYTPTEADMKEAYRDGREYLALDDERDGVRADAEFDRFIAQVRTDAAREALDGFSAWLGEVHEKHPNIPSGHVPLVQGNITRYKTDHYPQGGTDGR